CQHSGHVERRQQAASRALLESAKSGEPAVFELPRQATPGGSWLHWSWSSATGPWSRVAVQWRGFRPDGHEMKPLVEIKPEGWFEAVHDALGEFEPGGAVAQRRTVVRNIGQNMRPVTVGGPREVNGQNRAA